MSKKHKIKHKHDVLLVEFVVVILSLSFQSRRARCPLVAASHYRILISKICTRATYELLASCLWGIHQLTPCLIYYIPNNKKVK